MKHTFIIYTKPKIASFNGILGGIDVFTVHLLLAGGKYLIEETYDGTEPIEWYTRTLEDQGIYISASKQQKYKGVHYVWLEVDSDKTKIEEFAVWKDIDAQDEESLAWRKFVYPCTAGTTKECVGLAVVARELKLTKQGQAPMHVSNVLDAILQPGSKDV
jgi:hypothetical protein